MRLLSLLLIAIAIAIAACDHDEGMARVAFIIRNLDEMDKSKTFEVSARIEERGAGDLRGPILSSIAPVRLEPSDNELALPGLVVPHGENRVAIVELRELGEAHVAYYGISTPFSLQPGNNIDVPVLLDIVAAPKGSVLIQTSTNAPGFVGQPTVTLVFERGTASSVEISNKVGFPQELATSRVEDPGSSMSWDVDRGLDIPCAAAGSDYCPREVFVRFYDAADYVSLPVTAAVVVDTRPPSSGRATLAFRTDRDVGGRTLTRARDGTFVEVLFSVSEPLGAPAVLRAVRAGKRDIAFDACEGDNLAQRCSVTLDSDVHELGAGVTERWEVAGDFVDRVGNRASGVAVAEFDVDDQRPREPGNVVYYRNPWGHPAPDFRVIAGAGAVEPGSTIIVLNRPDFGVHQIIGSSTAADGEIRLEPIDLDRVYVLAVDEAGNVSDASTSSVGEQGSLVVDVEWLGRIGDQPLGTDLNPHAIERVHQFAETVLVQDANTLAPQLSREEVAAFSRGESSLLVEGKVAWRERTRSSADPLARVAHGFAFDRQRGRAVLFGGQNIGEARVAETREWDGNRWIVPSLETAEPDARYGMSVAYDAARGTTILFGGLSANGLLADTWTYDGARWIEVTREGPAARAWAAIAYDAHRGRVILFGGEDVNANFLADTWEWNGSTWESIPTLVSPAGRRYSAMAYDAERDRIVLFGGETLELPDLDDSWEYDAEARTWIPHERRAPIPSRRAHAMVYDERRQRVVVFGGERGFSGPDEEHLADAWQWARTGTVGTWLPLELGPTPVPARSRLAITYDSREDQILLFGGAVQLPDFTLLRFRDLWRIDASGATELTPTGEAPSGRADSTMIYDAARGQAMLFGGRSEVTWESDTWIWDGRNWRRVATATSAPAIEEPLLAIGPGGPILFSGGLFQGRSGVWSWSGSDWERRDLMATIEPPPRLGSAVAYDPSLDDVFMFGGYTFDVDGFQVGFGDAFAWTGADWTVRSPIPGPEPSPRWGHALASETTSGHVLMFGGFHEFGFALDALWEWDGVARTWIASSPSLTPPLRFEHTLVFDPLRSRVLAFGGLSELGGVLDDAWEYRRASGEWIAIKTVAQSPALAQHAAAYDLERRRLVVFGGCASVFCQAAEHATWELAREPETRPSVQVSFDWSNAARTAGSIESLEMSFTANGSGYDDVGARVDGASLRAWDARAGAWVEVTSVRREDAGHFVSGAGRIHLAVTPLAGSGNGTAAPEIQLMQIAVRVRYRVRGDDR